jgi:hypothetical protein
MRRPHFADTQEEQQLWEELRDHDASFTRALNEALRIHGGPAWRVFQVRRRSLARCFLPCSVVIAFVLAALIGFCLLVAGVGAPRPRQVRHPRPDER